MVTRKEKKRKEKAMKNEGK